jgi:hypothetical protein
MSLSNRLLAFASVLAIVFASTALVGCDSGGSNGDGGVTISGTLVNTTGVPVRGASLTLSGPALTSLQSTSGMQSVANVTVTTNENGEYSFSDVPSGGDYTVTVSANGYNQTTFSVDASSSTEVGSETLRGDAQVEGIVVNASTGAPLANADVFFSFGDNTDPELADLATQTNQNGTYTIADSPTGTFICVVRADGFADSVIEDVNFDEGENDIRPAATSEALESGQLRIVLTWGESPSDLDSHLTGPGTDGGRFHVYWSNRSPSNAGANLDRDDTSSFGPETITITDLRDGLYRYSVYNFSSSGSNGALGIADSPAQVSVFDETGQIRSYTAPSASSGDGNTWRVLELDVAGGSVSISDNGGSTLGYVSAGSSSDINSFRMPAKK